MNFDQAKSLRLQQWRATLDDQDFRMQNPEGHRETLREMASALCSEGLINQLEQFELNEMADAAYWHAVEELQDSSGQYRGASTYGVVQVDTGKLLGTISRSIFNFESDEPRGASFPYDGKVYSDAEGVRLTLGLSRKIGTISGLMLEMYGCRYQLIETERVISGVDYKPIDDPDAYRALVDVARAVHHRRWQHDQPRALHAWSGYAGSTSRRRRYWLGLDGSALQQRRAHLATARPAGF